MYKARCLPLLLLTMLCVLLLNACSTVIPSPTATTGAVGVQVTPAQQIGGTATASNGAITPSPALTPTEAATTPPISAVVPTATAVGGGSTTIATPTTQAPSPTATLTSAAESDVSAVTGINPYIEGQVPAAAPQPPVHYSIDASLNTADNTLQGNARIRFVNTSKSPWNEVFFRAYPNAFSERQYAQEAFFGSFDQTYPNGFNPSWFKLTGNDPALSLQADATGAQTLLRYQPAKPIAPGEAAEVTIQFQDKIPTAEHRFSVWRDIYAIGQWYPMLAVYDEGKGWFKDPYYANGDPFYDYISLFDVRLSVPADFQVASTGIEAAVTDSSDGKLKIHRLISGLVREFAFAASARYKVAETKVGEVTVRSFAPDTGSTNDAAAGYAADAIKYFSQVYGQYPYKVMNIAATAFPGGMEFPNVVFIGTSLYDRSNVLEFVIAHEVGHQWFYGMIGNNEVAEPFLDEGVTEFSTVAYVYNKYGGAQAANTKFGSMVSLPAPDPKLEAGLMHRSATSFSNFNDYDTLIYSYSAEMLLRFRDYVGQPKFEQIMQTFFKRYQYRNATVNDFMDVVREVGGQDAYNWLKPYS